MTEHYPARKSITCAKLDEALDLADCGITDGFLQELSSAKEEYIPPFNLGEEL